MSDFGTLHLNKPDGSSQEFILNKDLVTLGRATTNDIVLPGGRVSRNHAQIQCTEDAVIVTDLHSANGVWVNGERIAQIKIQPGDRIEISGNTLQYLPPAPDTAAEVTVINSEQELEMTLLQMSVPSSLNDTSGPRLVIHGPDRTWELPLQNDAYTIGCTTTNDLVLDCAKISRHYARLERKGGEFILRDLQSTNGTLIGDQRIEQHRLKNGDTFRIGPTRIVFKDGFIQEELTIADGLDLRQKPALVPVIFVPGTMGSELWRGSQRVWPNVNLLFKQPETLRYSQDTPLKPRGILNEMVVVPNLISFDQYNLLGDYLVEELGYERGKWL